MTRPQRVDALVAAADTLRVLGIDQGRAIDPFDAIERLGLDLVIADLDNLLGAVLPHGNGGVLVTSRRPIGVQRYTAAHEIGHWVLHSDELRLDGDGEVLGRPSNERERQAQLFAAYFLMPPPLMEAAVARHGLTRGTVRPEQVYLVSRDVDVSYEAAIRRLAIMHLISPTEVSALLRVGRLNALKRAFDGRRPKDGNAQLWSADASLDRVSLPVRDGDDVLVMLPENRTTGWQWLDNAALQRRSAATRRPRPTAPTIDRMPRFGADRSGQPEQHDAETRDGALTAQSVERVARAAGDDDTATPLTIVGDEFQVRGDGPTDRDREQRRRRISGRTSPGHDVAVAGDMTAVLVGATGQRTVAVHCAEPGEWTFDLHYAHAYDPTQPPAAQYQLRLQVDPTPAHAYRLRRLAADLDLRLPGDPADDAEFEVAP